MSQSIRTLISRETIGSVAPTIALGAAACVLLVVLSMVLTGHFVFESVSSRGQPEHVSPYFGGVVGALLTTGLITSWQLVARIRAE